VSAGTQLQLRSVATYPTPHAPNPTSRAIGDNTFCRTSKLATSSQSTSCCKVVQKSDNSYSPAITFPLAFYSRLGCLLLRHFRDSLWCYSPVITSHQTSSTPQNPPQEIGNQRLTNLASRVHKRTRLYTSVHYMSSPSRHALHQPVSLARIWARRRCLGTDCRTICQSPDRRGFVYRGRSCCTTKKRLTKFQATEIFSGSKNPAKQQRANAGCCHLNSRAAS
jgi:hypothetical protein